MAAVVSVVGSGRNRIAEGTWLPDDLRVRITTTKSEIDRSKSQFWLAALLQGIADVEELQRPKKIPSKHRKGIKTRGAKDADPDESPSHGLLLPAPSIARLPMAHTEIVRVLAT
jgi:hypothetical protein